MACELMAEGKQEVPIGGGEMGERIRVFDWSKTPLGAAENWSSALRMMVNLLLANRFPLLLWWGPQYISIYNDAYRPVLGTKHPWALGRPVSECWNEIWHILQPLIDTPFHGGPSTWNDDIQLEINRHGFVEETHFTIAYSPVPDETVPSGIGGVLATVHEITGKVVSDRRVEILRELGAHAAQAKTAEEACAIAAATMAAHPKDFPFALLYLIEPDRKTARLAGMAGMTLGELANPAKISLNGNPTGDSPWPLVEAMRSEGTETVIGLTSLLAGQAPPGPWWSDPPDTAAVVPIRSNKAHHLAGFLVAGLSPRLQFDDSYRDFLNLVSSQIAASIANAREYQEEKKRAEALAEIDRAKTAFFSNVSHEFRTPLTLMLGPAEELLSGSHMELPPAAKGRLEVIHRNGVRLSRLVNTLLDFSRIEAGRTQAVFEPTNLAAFTAGLASAFCTATERAGLRLSVDCPTLSEAVYVDREMWEKIVLNLVSNAFKFTFEGEIAVTLRAVDGAAELRVRDTGVGISDEEIPRLFERFYRAPNVRSRTYEGSGIGLALVQDLAKLHGGSVRVESRLGEGSTFIVSVPLGKAHLPPERAGARTLAPASLGAAPFVEEALRWLPDLVEDAEPLPAEQLAPVSIPPDKMDASLPWLLVADDNADMRQYLARLLRERYRVEAVADGEAALAAARGRRPDLILSDVMMPRLDGTGLVHALRADAALRTVPVILLSARAGEESRVEGLQNGADDYLIKPFSARELLARVASHLELARVRSESQEAIRKSEEKYRLLFENMTQMFQIVEPIFDDEGKAVDYRYVEVNQASEKLIGKKRQQIEGRTAKELWGIVEDYWFEMLGKVLRTGEPVRMENYSQELDRFYDVYAWKVGERKVSMVSSDTTMRRRVEEALRESERRFRAVAETVPDILYSMDADGRMVYCSPNYLEYTGLNSEEAHADGFATIHPEDRDRIQKTWEQATTEGVPFRAELRMRRHDGTYRWFLTSSQPFRDETGRIAGWFGASTDIEDQKQIERALRSANEDLNQFAYAAAHDLREPLRNVRIFSELLVRSCGDGADHRFGQIKEVISDSVQRMEDLLKDLLDYAQMAGSSDESKGAASIRAALEKALLNLETVIRSSGAEIVCGDLPALAVGEAHFVQLFQNLVGNAIQYRSQEPPRITISATIRPGEWLFSVRDNGIGIAPEFHQKIFGLFKRLHGKIIPGTGIGLAVCQRIVERYGGRIWVASEIGKGAEFFFTIPLGRDERFSRSI